MLTVTAGPFSFKGVLETEKAPKTVAAFERLLPFHSKIIHVRWSGESAWIPLGDLDIGLDGKPENATSHPAPGQVLWYPGGLSETEILFPYGGTMFASIVGQLAGQPLPDDRRGRRPAAPARGARTVEGRARHRVRSRIVERVF